MDKPDLLWKAFVETIQMVGISGIISLALGIPFGVLLYTTKTGGILENRPIHFVLGKICDVFRSIPFILLAILLIGLSRLILGTGIGVKGAIIPLLCATIPYLGRQVEGALAEVPDGLVEAAQAMGCSPWQIITKVMLSECRPSLINGLTTATITILSYGAMAGAIGAGGLGSMALMKGYQRKMKVMLWGSVVLLVLLVQIIQSIGTAWSVKSDRRINPTETKKRRT